MNDMDKKYAVNFKWCGKRYKCDDFKYFETLKEAQDFKRKMVIYYLTSYCRDKRNSSDWGNNYTTQQLYDEALKVAKKYGNQLSVTIYKRTRKESENSVFAVFAIEEIE